ncbi:glycosyltransferase family 2 protein [Flavobacterium sp. LB1P71]|uniref:glycosyltransferase family 2 protein n=1 Tax=unclassified Flavobacterium TaxID=196869 RepID=UPI003AAAB83A
MKKLAVLLPTYNTALYLKSSIDSILNQTFHDFDLYVYDDCSTDNTAEIVSSYSNSRIFYRKNEANLGIAKTLNRGLDELLPLYEFIARMDADDWAYSQRFEKQLDFLDKNKEILLCGTQGYWLKDFNEKPLKGWTYPTNTAYIKYYLLFAATFGHSSVIFRSQAISNHNLRYDEAITTCEDWELWVRISKIGKMANLPDFLMKYRILENSNHRSLEKINKHLEERSKIISNYWNYFDIPFFEEEIHELYFGKIAVSRKEFNSKIQKLIGAFNAIYHKTEHSFSIKDKKDFRYLLARKILNYWKRSQISRSNPLLWIMIVSKVEFMNKIKLVKSIIR